ncbi:probable YOR1-ABC transporter [Sporisorium reilianum f. sp. reilianum]|uniref:Probable YOR1-ABC transporter n=1 Tax=Sporisorium reilianum f. sp. reilianum TaxID=72559 RepID=A0A2N8U6T0_9BASI|nr:probable YOR1-ABC transporter [Sporisorium reilianum f. sp. reilianum]
MSVPASSIPQPGARPDPASASVDTTTHSSTTPAGPSAPSAIIADTEDESHSESSRSAAPSSEKAGPVSTAGEEKPGYEYNPGNRSFVGGKHKEKWYQVWRPKNPPPAPPSSLDDATLLPLANANIISRIFFQWMTPIMVLGYQRPLEATDLWALSDDLSAKQLGGQLNKDWERRVRQAKDYNAKLVSGEIRPGWTRRASWALRSTLNPKGGSPKQREASWRAPPRPAPTAAAGPPGPPKPGQPKPKSVKDPSGHKKPSLVWAMHDQLVWKLWSGLLFKIVGDTSLITSPLVLKAIIKYAQELYAAHARGVPGPPVGHGVGLSFALFFMQIISSLGTHQFFWRSMSCGVESRAALITAIFERAMKMNGKARSSGKLINHISTDCSRIDFASAWFSVVFAAPVQMIICIIILLTQLGPSALAGFAIMVLAVPLQLQAMKALFTIRRASMKWTDARAKTIQEVLGGMRIVKSFSHEAKFLERIYDIRKNELNGIRKILIIRSANNAIAFSLPILAAVLAFVVYSLTGHDLNPAVVFPSLTLFQLLRMPLIFLPLSLSATTDARNAFDRLYTTFTAEQLEDTVEHNQDSKYALVVRDGSFRWEAIEADETLQSKAKPKAGSKGAEGAKSAASTSGMFGKAKKLVKKSAAPPAANEPGLPAPVSAKKANTDTTRHLQEIQAEQDDIAADGDNEATVTEAQLEPTLGEATDAEKTAEEAQEPFSMSHINLSIQRGELVAIVGPVGSGKSSFLQACIGEMRQTGGSVQWGSERVAYCSQSAWIQNATLRDNILFGQSFDEGRYWEAVKVSELEADLAILPAGDLTEIGEKGVNLSGGQKQRVNIARALYYNADIVCLDDPLSAVDAHVGKALFYNAIMGLRARGATVLLVTHALHFLPDVDRIITLEDGRIVEMGTYDELNTANGPFQRLVVEFGGEKEKDEEQHKEDEAEAIEETEGDSSKAKKPDRANLSGGKAGDKAGALMQAEERNTGSVSLRVYLTYLKYGRGVYMVPICVGSIVLMQVANILNSYWLIWWQKDHFHEPIGFYMGIYAMLGVVMTIFTFIMGCTMGFLSYYACKRVHHEAIQRVVYAPMAWLDVTPIGRIMNRFAKDVDVVDNQLADAVRMAANTLASVAGAVILITILTHYFVIAVAVVLVFYFYGALFYRSSAREVKRLDAILRSSLYSHFSETLSGLTTIRAYRETDTFITENQKRMDVENRAYYLSITNQRWLGVRLDMLGALLVLIVALLTTASSTPITGGNAGIALTYMLTVSQAFSWMTRQIAEVENDSASVERLLYYAEELEQEKAQTRADNPTRASWPEDGRISFKDIWLSYRPGLPSVLKGISFDVGSGEKVGIVGRTGAGKSSLLTALLRLVELSKGSIEIDGVDVGEIGLEDLRRKLAILPQEPLLFSGTLRTNLDPFGIYDDARLNDALKRACLIGDDTHTHGAATPVMPAIEASSDTASLSDDEKKALAASGDSTPGRSVSRINLDAVIEEEGANLSVGQRSLVSLARALVKNSKIILLDEATASVDLETDAKIQQTIREEFANRTILCIAHRLRTILSYDRIAVFDQGELAEYASPLELFDRPEGIFHSMCERSNITRDEIVRNAAKPSSAAAF